MFAVYNIEIARILAGLLSQSPRLMDRRQMTPLRFESFAGQAEIKK